MYKKNSRALIISLMILSLALGVCVILLLIRPAPVALPLIPGAIDRVQTVPPSIPMPINGKRPFVLTLVNRCTTEVDVDVTITGVTGAPIVQPYKIPKALSPTQGYYLGILIDKNLGGYFPGTNFNYKIDLSSRNSSSNVYAIYSDSAVIVQ